MNKSEENQLKKRIIEIAFKQKTSHLGSHLSSLKIIDYIFSIKKEDDIFILSSGHSALSLYVVLEKYYSIDAETLFLKHGGHPQIDEGNHIYCSTGSLGMGITVAVGRALANPNRKVYCLISDGECAEGSVWESLCFVQEQNIQNIEIYCNINGYCAYDKVDVPYLKERLKIFYPQIHLVDTKVEHFPFLRGLNAHYYMMKECDYLEALRICNET